jgi:hypothetical protein
MRNFCKIYLRDRVYFCNYTTASDLDPPGRGKHFFVALRRKITHTFKNNFYILIILFFYFYRYIFYYNTMATWSKKDEKKNNVALSLQIVNIQK